MNDRFKFRVWDKENKCMHYPSRYSNFNIVNGVIVKIDSYLTGNGVYRGKGVAYEFDDAVIMQSTGLKDKNGKLIYEGDIIENLIIKAKYIVVFSNAKFMLKSTISESYLSPDTNFNEVIGNIYENKELINENS